MTENKANVTETVVGTDTREAWIAPRITRMHASDAEIGAPNVVEAAFNYGS